MKLIFVFVFWPRLVFGDHVVNSDSLVKGNVNGPLEIEDPSGALFGTVSGNHSVCTSKGGIPDDFYVCGDQINPKYIWPRGVVVYDISSHFTVSQIKMIREAQNQITKATNACITFKKKENESDYIRITRSGREECSSSVGRQGGSQNLILDNGCFSYPTLNWILPAHQFIHALGFWHEHCRMDRDSYVHVFTCNVQPDHWYDFRKSLKTSSSFSYDYSSIMHLDWNDLAIDPVHPTILPKPGQYLGPRTGITRTDAMKIKKLYGCI